MSAPKEPSGRQVRGDCGHLKALYDNHSDCRRCCVKERGDCSASNPCDVSSQWSDSTWKKTQSMRSYASKRKSKDRSSRSVDSPQRVSTSVQGTSSHAHEGSSGIAPSLHRSPKPSQVSSVRPSTGQRTGDQTASSKLSRASSRSSTGQRTQSDSQLVLATDHQASATDKSAMSSHRTPNTGHRTPDTGHRPRSGSGNVL